MAKSKGKIQVKVPKRIAGMKIPKPIRKGPVGDFLNSSGGQVLVAEALLIAGSAMLAKRGDPDSKVGNLLRNPLDQLKEAGRGTAAAASHSGEAIGDARRRLAAAFSAALEAFRDSLDQDDYSKDGHLPRGNGAATTPAHGQNAPNALDGLNDDEFDGNGAGDFGKKKRFGRSGGVPMPDVASLSPSPQA